MLELIELPLNYHSFPESNLDHKYVVELPGQML